MKARVRLSYTIELSVEGNSEEAIVDWMSCITPEEVRDLVDLSQVTESYDEEFICPIANNSAVDYVIKDEED